MEIFTIFCPSQPPSRATAFNPREREFLEEFRKPRATTELFSEPQEFQLRNIQGPRPRPGRRNCRVCPSEKVVRDKTDNNLDSEGGVGSRFPPRRMKNGDNTRESSELSVLHPGEWRPLKRDPTVPNYSTIFLTFPLHDS